MKITFKDIIDKVKVIISDDEEENCESFVIDENIVVDTEGYSLDDDYSESIIGDFTLNYIDYALEHCDFEPSKYRIKYSKDLKEKFLIEDSKWFCL